MYRTTNTISTIQHKWMNVPLQHLQYPASQMPIISSDNGCLFIDGSVEPGLYLIRFNVGCMTSQDVENAYFDLGLAYRTTGSYGTNIVDIQSEETSAYEQLHTYFFSKLNKDTYVRRGGVTFIFIDKKIWFTPCIYTNQPQITILSENMIWATHVRNS